MQAVALWEMTDATLVTGDRRVVNADCLTASA